MWITFPIYIFNNTENAAFRIYGTDGAVFIDPHLRQIVPDKVVAGHGCGCFPASAGSGAGTPRDAVAGPIDTGYKHMFGQLIAPVLIHGLVNGKPVISFFQQQRVSGVRAIKAVGGLITSIHKYPCVGQVFGPVQTFAVNIGVEMPQAVHLFVKIGKSVSVKDFRAV
jgi:hypothetical protein